MMKIIYTRYAKSKYTQHNIIRFEHKIIVYSYYAIYHQFRTGFNHTALQFDTIKMSVNFFKFFFAISHKLNTADEYNDNEYVIEV